MSSPSSSATSRPSRITTTRFASPTISSSSLEELGGLAHRVLVMRLGRLVAELEGDGISESAILGAAFAEAG